MRQVIGRVVVLLLTLSLLAASSALAAGSGAIVTLGGKQSLISSSPVLIDGALYVPLDVISVLGGSYTSEGASPTVQIKLPDYGVKALPVTRYKGEALVSMADLSKLTSVTAQWESGARTLRLFPQVSGLKYANGVLVIRTTYPVRFTSRLFEGLKVFVVDIPSVKLGPQARGLPIGEGYAIRARISQFTADMVRVAIDVSKPTKFSVTEAKGLIVVPIAPKPPAPTVGQPPHTGPVVTAPSLSSASKKVEVTGVKFQPIDDGRCRLIIEATGRVEARGFSLRNPTRLVIDVTEATLRGGVTESASPSHSLVRGIRVAQFSENPKTVRVVLDLTKQAPFSIMQSGVGKVVVDINNPTIRRGIKGSTIVVDPGHGGAQPGAVSLESGFYEKDINLAVARLLSDLLQTAGANVALTRYDDTTVSLADRPALATSLKADVFISIHCNALNSPTKVSGTETYYHKQDSTSRELAACVQGAVVRAAGTDDGGYQSDTTIYASGFKALRDSTVPAALLEMGYLDHPSDMTKLTSEDSQRKFAEGIFQGIKTFLEGEKVGTDSQKIEVAPY